MRYIELSSISSGGNWTNNGLNLHRHRPRLNLPLYAVEVKKQLIIVQSVLYFYQGAIRSIGYRLHILFAICWY